MNDFLNELNNILADNNIESIIDASSFISMIEQYEKAKEDYTGSVTNTGIKSEEEVIINTHVGLVTIEWMEEFILRIVNNMDIDYDEELKKNVIISVIRALTE